MSVSKSKNNNGNRNKRKPRSRRGIPRQMGFTGLTYAKAENWDLQYFPLAEPAFSATFRVDLLSSTARLGAQAVRFKKGTLVLQTYQPNDTLFSYRVDVFRNVSPLNLTDSATALDPLAYYSNQPNTASFIDSVPRVRRDQTSRMFEMISSKVFTQATRYEHDPRTMITRIPIPAHTAYYDPDAINDNKGIGLILVCLMTDATADSATHGVLGFLQQRYQIHF